MIAILVKSNEYVRYLKIYKKKIVTLIIKIIIILLEHSAIFKNYIMYFKNYTLLK